jgi:4-amino-4-deoxy-L-arabinose transferase-like glycosyltransferase
VFGCQRRLRTRDFRSLSRERLRRLAGLWLDALVERYPLVPVAVVLGVLVLLPPPEVAALAVGMWALWHAVEGNKKKRLRMVKSYRASWRVLRIL